MELLASGRTVFIDDEDYPKIQSYKLVVDKRNLVLLVKPEHSIKKLHRFLLPCPAGLQIDHINRNRLDNRKANLRIVTASQNSRNMGIKSDNSTGYKGVQFIADHGKYRARIRTDSGRVSLGHFKTALEAAHAYDKAAKLYHGVYAFLNFPEKEL